MLKSVIVGAPNCYHANSATVGTPNPNKKLRLLSC
jgi:hypothetical protein